MQHLFIKPLKRTSSKTSGKLPEVYVITKASWGDCNSVSLISIQDLENTIELISKYTKTNTPTSLELTKDDSSSMFIILGTDYSLALFRESENAPVWCNAPGKDSPADGCMEYDYMGHQSFVENKHTIPTKEAIKALILYYETGERPENIDWE